MAQQTDALHFNYRTVAVALHGGHLLIHRAAAETSWSLPGGRVELGEPAAAALAREMHEELGVAVQVGRLIWIVENFFADAGRRYHELGLYFAVTFPTAWVQAQGAEPFDGIEPGKHLIYQWYPLAALGALPFHPRGLRERLAAPPIHPTHLVSVDGVTRSADGAGAGAPLLGGTL